MLDEIVTIVLIVGILGIIGLFTFYVIKTYVMPKRVDELVELINSGQAALAIRKLNNMVEEDDRNPYLRYLLGEAHQQLDQSQESIMEYKQSLKYLDGDARAKEDVVRDRLAKMYLRSRNYNEAKKEFLILTKLKPNDPENYYQVGVLFENAGLSEKALPYFMQAVQIRPNHEDSQFHIGVINYNYKNIQESKSALTECIKTNSKHSGAHYYLGQCLRSAKDVDWAIKEFDLASRDEDWKARSLLGKALCLHEKELYHKEVTELDKAMECAGGSQELKMNIYYQMAAAAEKLRDFNTAIASWEKIQEINPGFRDVTQKLGTYEEFRVHDSIKDFMIASPGKFERMCRDLVEREGYSVTDLTVKNDSEVNITAADATEGTGWRAPKRPNTLFIIYRTTSPIPEKEIRSLHESMRNRSVSRAICMTTSEFSTQTEIFCQSRPIELIDRKGLISRLREML